jgi:hypothetical protein
LGAGLVLQAIRDLAGNDPVNALDALAFWLDSDGGAGWLDALGLSVGVDPVRAFQLALRGASHGKYKFGGSLE